MEELGCPNCHSTRLRSDETAIIGYPVTFSLGEDGERHLEYTGESSSVYDEATEYQNDIWCRDCGRNFREEDLVVVTDED